MTREEELSGLSEQHQLANTQRGRMTFKRTKQRTTEASFLPILGNGNRTNERRITKDLHTTRPDEIVAIFDDDELRPALCEIRGRQFIRLQQRDDSRRVGLRRCSNPRRHAQHFCAGFDGAIDAGSQQAPGAAALVCSPPYTVLSPVVRNVSH